MAESALFESPESRRLCLRYVTRHPVAFREYIIQLTYKRRVWHRHGMSPVLLAMDQGDTLYAAGRATGKSFYLLEPEIVRHAISHPGEETLVTSLRRLHIVDRLEKVIEYFSLPLFERYVKKNGIKRQPSYTIMLTNGHIIYGISTGDDVESKMTQGKHASLMVLEEAHQYPMRAWAKLQGAKDLRGCRVLMVGVPDGRVDTPFRNADSKMSSFAGRRFHYSARYDPYFNQSTKQDKIDVFGGEESDFFIQEVDAEWGSPSWSAWDLNALYRCMTLGPVPEWWPVEISGKLYKAEELTPELACGELPGCRDDGETIVAMDVGYSQPSEIFVFRKFTGSGKWTLLARVQITNRMEHDDQAKILNEVCARYEANWIGVDATEGEGRAIATELEVNWGRNVHRISSNENVVTGWARDKDGKDVEVKETGRMVATRWLRGLFSREELALPADEDFITEFNQEMETRGADGIVRVKTPSTVHIPDAMRVFAMVLFFNNPPRPPEEEMFEDVEPEWADRMSPWGGSELVEY